VYQVQQCDPSATPNTQIIFVQQRSVSADRCGSGGKTNRAYLKGLALSLPIRAALHTTLTQLTQLISLQLNNGNAKSLIQ